jgi:hypothetical protein
VSQTSEGDTEKSRQMLRHTLIAVFLVLPAPDPAALADTPTDPQTLNRSGHWSEAGRAARKLLADPALTPRERCETWFQLIYADTHTGDRESARNGISAFDGECADYPPSMWFRREVEKLRAELDPQRVPRPPVRDDDGWPAADPEALGLNVPALSEHRELCEASGADACLVAYRGRIVQEWYGPGYREPMYTMSSVKSWTGLLAGLLIADGKLGLDDPVAKYIPEWKAGAEASSSCTRRRSTSGAGPSTSHPATSAATFNGATSTSSAARWCCCPRSACPR